MIRKEVSGENGGEILSQGLLLRFDERSLPASTVFLYSINFNYLNLFVQKKKNLIYALCLGLVWWHVFISL